MSGASEAGRIDPADIRAKLGELQGEAEQQVESAKQQIVAVGALVLVVMLIVAFLLGRRGGRRSSAVIEVRRS
jgi:hypothetical protein